MSISLAWLIIFILFSIDIFAQASFQGLGDLPGGILRSTAYGVSADGSVVVGESISANGPEAFRWTAGGGMVGLGDLPGSIFRSSASGVSADGSVVVGWSSSANGSEAFRWTAGGGMVGLGDLPGGPFNSHANGVSADGSVVVGESSSANGSEAFRWTAGGGMVGLGGLPGYSISSASGVSADGSVVVGWSAGTVQEAFRWTAGGGMVGLGDLPGGPFSSAALGVSADGSVVVGESSSANGTEAFHWTESDGMRNIKDILETDYGLDLTGWTLNVSFDVSDDGTVIVGYGTNPNGDTEAWRAVLPSNIVAWSSGQGGGFSVGSNWIGGAVPDTSQIALFDSSFYTSTILGLSSGQPITITFDNAPNTFGLFIRKSQVIFDLQAHSYGVKDISVGSSQADFPHESQLEIINGALGTTASLFGSMGIGTLGKKGEVIVNNGGILEIEGDNPGASLEIGVDGNCGGAECGRLIIQNGGIFYSNSSGNGSSTIGGKGGQGSVYISGDGSEWVDSTLVVIGEQGGTGLLDINNSGQFTGNALWLGLLDSSSGTVIVSDTASYLELSEEFLMGFGPNSEGHLTISNGAIGILKSGIQVGIANSSNCDVTVKDETTALSISDTTFIGKSGSGGLSVLSGADMFSSTAVIPGDWGGIGSALVDGESSTWEISGALWIGQRGVGFVRVTNQGTLRADAMELGPLGSIEASGGNLYIGGNPVQSRSMIPIVSRGGALEQVIGGSVFVDTLLLSTGAQVLADSVIFGEGGYLGSEDTLSFDVTNAGGINPGDSVGTPGIFTVDANYTQLAGGTLFIELGGPAPGDGHDQLVVTGTTNLAGTLNVSRIGTFEPQVGQTFEILTAMALNGTFENIEADGLEVSANYSDTSVVITVTFVVSVENKNEDVVIPDAFKLEQNYPNPFNPTTLIQFSVPKASNVRLKLYDILGREVGTLIDEAYQPGVYKVQFEAGELPSGLYVYRLQAVGFVQSHKMILLK